MNITKEKLLELCACEDGITWFEQNQIGTVEQGINLLWETDHSEKFKWSNWILSRTLNHHNQVKYAVHAAEIVLPLWEKEFPEDKRPHEAIKAAKAWLENPSPENTEKCNQAAEAAGWAVNAAAWAAVAYKAAADAARAAGYAARAAADTAGWAANAANAAARAAAAANAALAAAAAATNADPTKAKEIIDYGLNLLQNQE